MIKISGPGGYDKLEYVGLPECGYTEGANIKLQGIEDADTVTVDVYACGVNYADVCIRWGVYKSAKEFVGWPITPGFEFSGTVSSVGANVSHIKEGDNVAGVTMFGAYSTKLKVPGSQVRRLPSNVSLCEGAGYLATAATAWYAMYELCRLRPGDAILVHSAAGGVGSMLVQMGRKSGCRVVGIVGSTHKVVCAQEFGCDKVIDKSKQDLWAEVEKECSAGYKAVFDANGADTLQASFDHLCRGGRLVSYGSHTLLPRSTESGSGYIGVLEWVKVALRYRRSPSFNPVEMMSQNRSVMAFNLSFMFSETGLAKQMLDELFSWLADGSIKVSKVKEYSLKKVADAHRDLESGQTVGKLVLLVQGEPKVDGPN